MGERPGIDETSLDQSIGAGSGPFSVIRWRDEATSTNDVAGAGLAAAPEDWPDLSVIGADHQTTGHGRLSRAWQVPPRSAVLVSVVLRPEAWGAPLGPDAMSWLPLLGGLAAVRAVRATTALDVGLKWPNDVIMAGSGKKLAGVLARAVALPKGTAVVLGCGINVSQSAEELPIETATSIQVESGAHPGRAALAEAYLLELADLYLAFVRSGGNAESAGLAAETRSLMITLGQRVRVSFPDGRILEGMANGLDGRGSLEVRDDEDEVHPLVAADITHLRRAQS